MMTTENPPYQLLPQLPDDAYARLKADIEANGIRQAIERDADTGLILDGHNRARIAEELGVECPSVQVPLGSEEEKKAYVYRVNLNRRQLSRKEEKGIREEQKRLAHLLNARHTQKEVGAMLGVVQQAVSRWLADTAITPRGNGGKTDHRKKLTEAEDAAIAEQLDAGETQEQVAADKGIPQQAVSRAKKRHDKKQAKEAARQRAASSPRKVEEFKRKVAILLETCRMAGRMDAPPLPIERVKELDAELRGAAKNVHRLRNNMEAL